MSASALIEVLNTMMDSEELAERVENLRGQTDGI